MLVYTDKEYSRVVDLWIHVADAAIGLRRASKNKEMWTKHIVCFTAVELEKNVTSYEIFEKFSYVRVLLIDGGAVKKNTWPQYEKKHTWYTTTRNHVFQLEQRSRGP